MIENLIKKTPAHTENTLHFTIPFRKIERSNT